MFDAAVKSILRDGDRDDSCRRVKGHVSRVRAALLERTPYRAPGRYVLCSYQIVRSRQIRYCSVCVRRAG